MNHHRYARYVAALVAVAALGEFLRWIGAAKVTDQLIPWFFDGLFGATALGGALLVLVTGRPAARVWIGWAASSAVVAAIVMTARGPSLPAAVSATGLAAIGTLGVLAARARSGARGEALARFYAGLVLPGYAFVSQSLLRLTTTLRPTTYDALAYVADSGFGFHPSFAVASWAETRPWVVDALQLGYVLLPLSFAGLFLVQRLRGSREDALTSFVVVGVAAYVVYLLFPVVGPKYAFAELFPGNPPVLPSAGVGPALVGTDASRNCMPSLHTAWTLLAFWQARPFGRAIRLAFGLFLAVTLAATIALGYHYLVDLVVAFPFTLAVLAATREVAGEAEARAARRTAVGAASMVALWLVLLRHAADVFALSAVLTWTSSALTVAACFFLEQRLPAASARTAGAAPAPARDAPAPAPALPLGIALVSFLSGFVGLCYLVGSARSLAPFGSAHRVTTVVLAIFLVGLALGAWLGGALASRTRSPLRSFALAQAGIGLWCAASPAMAGGLRSLYVKLAAGHSPPAPELVPLQLALGAALLLPPAILVGVSTPFLARHLASRPESSGRVAGLLHGVNAAGAAAGALLTGYLLLPALGVSGATRVGVAVSFCAAALGFLLQRKAAGPGRVGVPAAAVDDAPVGSWADGLSRARLAWTGLAVLGAGGFVTLGLGVVYVHLLAVVAGDSVYGSSLVVFSSLAGLSTGAWAGRALLRRVHSVPGALGALQLALAAVLLLTVFSWDGLPGYFASFAGSGSAATFGARELVRFVVCSGTTAPVALLIGAAYPLAMELVAAAYPGRRIDAFGRASALHALGLALGALAGGFWLIDSLGSLRSIQLLAAGAAVMGLSSCSLVPLRGLARLAPAPAAVLCLFVLQPASFDLARLSTGANVYFFAQPSGRIVDHAESAEGGLTTVTESWDGAGRRVLASAANGRFPGDGRRDGELAARYGLAVTSPLHAPDRDRALIIGLGTGTFVAVAAGAGFRELDVVEPSAGVVRMARRLSGASNGDILGRPGVRTHVTGGRGFLLLADRRYDLIGIEPTSIWSAGAAGLYSRELYELASARLAARGVLQQRVQLHHVSREDVLGVVATARSVFPHVWLYVAGDQGVLVGCAWDCRPSGDTVARLRGQAALDPFLESLGGVPGLVGARMLGPAAVDELLREARAGLLDAEAVVSTDDNLRLEHSTPRGNVRDRVESLRENVAMLERFRPPDPLADTRLPREVLAPEPPVAQSEPGSP